jgi:hypothetical protein
MMNNESSHNKVIKGGVTLDKRYNTPGETSQELKKALGKSKPSQNPNMSEAEAKLKFQGKR